MKQMSLDATGFERRTKRTRKREFLDEMKLVVYVFTPPPPPLPTIAASRLDCTT
jgi:hypothetical protein